MSIGCPKNETAYFHHLCDGLFYPQNVEPEVWPALTFIIHTPGQVIMLLYKLLREVGGVLLSILEIVSKKGGGEMVFTRRLLRVLDHHMFLADKGDQESLRRPQMLIGVHAFGLIVY